jgi:hypothetical protein
VNDAPEQTIEELLATSTAPANIPFQLKGFANEKTAQDLANRTATYIRYIGTRMNLEDLDGVTVAYDYAKALTEIDRGYETSHVLTASTEIAHGVAMAPGVFRAGVLKSHLAFNANVLMHLMDGEGENFSQVYYQLAHECGHVHDRAAFDVAIPGLLQRPYDFGSDLARIQFGLSWGSWCEYAATRLSASFYPEQVAHFEETFFAALEGLDDRVEAAVDAFRDDNDGWKCFNAVTGEYDRFLTFTSYLLGHLNGLGGDVDLAPKFKEFLQSGNWLAKYLIDLDKTLEEIWNKYGEWKSFEEFNGIGELVLLLAASDGVHLTAEGLSIY